MQAKFFFIVSLMALISCSWCAVTLYSFGPKVGDRTLLCGANPAEYVKLKESYTIYGKSFTHIYVSHEVNVALI